MVTSAQSVWAGPYAHELFTTLLSLVTQCATPLLSLSLAGVVPGGTPVEAATVAVDDGEALSAVVMSPLRVRLRPCVTTRTAFQHRTFANPAHCTAVIAA
jgi:hypothetical protein